MEHTKVDDNKYIMYLNNNVFETYEYKRTKLFKDISEMSVFMSKLIIKADKLDFKIKDFKVSKNQGCNLHYGLLPDSDYKFSGELELERKKGYRNKPHLHDNWGIMVLDNGEITAQYEKWGQMPEELKQQKEFMKEHSIDKLL